MQTQRDRLDYGLSFVRRRTCFTAQIFNIRRRCSENGAFGAPAGGKRHGRIRDMAES